MLGRGLESLIPNKSGAADDGEFAVGPPAPPPAAKLPLTKPPAAVFQIEVERIKPNPHQPRREFSEESLRELAASIREFGIIQPLVVSKIERETDAGTKVEYELIAGERRLLAAKLLGLPHVPAVIRKVDAEKEKLEMAIVENLQRADLNPIETARAYAKLADEFRLTQREIAARVGKSREAVANTLRLLSLPSKIQSAVAEGVISESQARILLMIDDPLKQESLFEEIAAGSVSVRELKNKISRGFSSVSDRNEAASSPEILDFKNKLEETLGAKVDIVKKGNAGRISIDFFSTEELSNIIGKIVGEKDELKDNDS